MNTHCINYIDKKNTLKIFYVFTSNFLSMNNTSTLNSRFNQHSQKIVIYSVYQRRLFQNKYHPSTIITDLSKPPPPIFPGSCTRNTKGSYAGRRIRAALNTAFPLQIGFHQDRGGRGREGVARLR